MSCKRSLIFSLKFPSVCTYGVGANAYVCVSKSEYLPLMVKIASALSLRQENNHAYVNLHL